MPVIPSGTVTFLFSDIEGSTELLKRLGDRYADVLAEHRKILRTRFNEHGGHEIDTQGDAFFYAFPRARAAVAAAVESQRELAAHDWPDGANVRVRIGLHSGEPAVGEEGYTGLDVVRAARISTIASGQQVLLSETTSALVGDDLPDGIGMRPLGRRKLKGIDRPEPIFTLLIPDLPLPVAAVEADADAKLSAEAADRARQAIERRVLADLDRAIARAEAGKTDGWSKTVRWVLVTLIVMVGSVMLVSAVIALLRGVGL